MRNRAFAALFAASFSILTTLSAGCLGEFVPEPEPGDDAGRVGPAPMDAGLSKPTIKPFRPFLNGLNTIDLSQIDKAFAGQSLTFGAKRVGASVQLYNIEVNAAPGLGLRMVHPLFVTWDERDVPTPDPADSFATLDQTVFAGETLPMGPGLLLLPDFADADLMGLAFVSIVVKEGSKPDGGMSMANTPLKAFAEGVRPRLQKNSLCTNCHSEGATGLTIRADLSDEDLRSNLRKVINLTVPESSKLLVKPNPGVADGHPGKFAPGADYDQFAAAAKTWINLEK